MNINEEIKISTMQSNVFFQYTDEMNDYMYFDIWDTNMLHAFSNECKKQIFIGIDEDFIKAINECREWELYNVLYSIKNCYKVKKTSILPSITLSAIGLLKRIVSHKNFHYVSFVFKHHQEIYKNGVNKIINLYGSNISVHLSSCKEKNLPNISTELKRTFEKFLNERNKISYVVIQLIDVPLIDRHFVIQTIVDVLYEIQDKKEINILIQKKISHSIYSTYDINHYEPIEQLLEYDDKSIIDYITEAWRENALLLSI